MPEVSRIFKLDGHAVLSPVPIAEVAREQGWPMPWWGKVNSVACPRGRQYGEAHFLVSQDTLDDLTLSAAMDITCEHENGTTTWAGYYVTRTQAVSRDTDKPAHWITLADRRWLFEKVACQKRYNLRTGDSSWVTSSLNSGTPYTWQEVIDDLWALLPAAVAMAVPSLASAAASTPENLLFDGLSAWQAINRVATAIGCGICYDPLTETFTLPELKETQDDLAALKTANENRLLWQYTPQDLPATNYPEKVKVSYQQIPGIEGYESPFIPEPITDEVSLSVGGAVGTSWPIRDTLFARPANAAARTARTAEIRDALIGLLRPMAEPWGAVYSGVVPFVTGEEITEVTWSSDGSRGMRTIAKYSRTEFDWPVVPGFVTVDSAVFVAPVGGIPARTGTSSPWTPGSATCTRLSYSIADLVSTSASEVVYNATASTIPEGTLVIADRVEGKWTIDAAASSVVDFFHFTLTANLAGTVGATATADATAANTIGGATTAITVTNPGTFRAFSGATGLAAKVAEDVYWIIVVDQPALRVRVKLDAHPNSSGGAVRFGADPREADAAIKLASPAPVALTPYPFSFVHSSVNPATSTGLIPNTYDKFGENGDWAILEWDASADAYFVSEVIPQRQQEFWATIATDRPAGLGQIISCTPVAPATDGAFPSSPVNVTDLYNAAINGKSTHKLLAKWNADSGGYQVVVSQHTARRVKCTVAATFSGTPATFTATVVNGMDGLAPTGTLTIQNRYDWPDGTLGNPLEVLWDTHAGEWYPDQMKWSCPA